MQNNKISSHPPVKKNVDEFILGAERKKVNYEQQSKEPDIIYPWQESNIRNDVQKVFTVKLPEEFLLKIKFISEKTNKSQQKIVREILSEEIDKLISKLV